MATDKKQTKSFGTNLEGIAGQGLNNLVRKTTEQANIPDITEPVKIIDKVDKPKDKNKIYNEETGLFDDRTTIVVEHGLYDKIADIAYLERLTIKDILNEAMKRVVKEYELKHGTIPQRPPAIKRGPKPKK